MVGTLEFSATNNRDSSWPVLLVTVSLIRKFWRIAWKETHMINCWHWVLPLFTNWTGKIGKYFIALMVQIIQRIILLCYNSYRRQFSGENKFEGSERIYLIHKCFFSLDSNSCRFFLCLWKLYVRTVQCRLSF